MKIGILLNTSWYIYNFRKNLISALLSKGFEVHAIAPIDEYSQRLIELGCNYHQLDFDAKSKNPLKDLFLLRRIRNELAEIRPDVMLNFTIKPNVYGTLAASSLGISCINNIAGRGTFFDESSLSRFIFKFLFRISQKRADWVFCQNPEDYELLLKDNIISKEKSSLLPGSGVNLNEFTFTHVEKKPIITFLLMARMIYPKGIKELLEAAKLLRDKNYTNFKILLLGELGVNNPNAIPKSFIENYDKESYIDYLGKTDKVIPIIKKSDVMVLPSYYREGTPKSLLEALAIGRPIITTNMPGCKETIIDGVNGFIVKPRSIEDLAEKMEKFLNLSHEERNEMGVQSRFLAEKKFNEQFVIDEYFKILKKTKND